MLPSLLLVNVTFNLNIASVYVAVINVHCNSHMTKVKRTKSVFS